MVNACQGLGDVTSHRPHAGRVRLNADVRNFAIERLPPGVNLRQHLARGSAFQKRAAFSRPDTEGGPGWRDLKPYDVKGGSKHVPVGGAFDNPATEGRDQGRRFRGKLSQEDRLETAKCVFSLPAKDFGD